MSVSPSHSYLVWTKSLALSELPLQAPAGLRRSYTGLFGPTCLGEKVFEHNRWIAPDASGELTSYSKYGSRQPGRAPFIQGVGSFYFEPRSIRNLNWTEREFMKRVGAAMLIKPGKEGYLASSPGLWQRAVATMDFLRDQRLLSIHLELTNPPVFHCANASEQISAKLFTHIHPIGYLVFHVAVAVNSEAGLSADGLHSIARSTEPWNKTAKLKFSTREGLSTLQGIVSNHIERVWLSLFGADSASCGFGESKWYASIATNESNFNEPSMTQSPFAEFTGELVESYRREKTRIGGIKKKPGSGSILRVSGRGLNREFNGKWKRHDRLRVLWDDIYMLEDLLVRAAVYREFSNLLHREVITMREFRYSPWRRIRENLVLQPVLQPLIMSFDSVEILDGSRYGSSDLKRRKLLGQCMDCPGARDGYQGAVRLWSEEQAKAISMWNILANAMKSKKE